MSNEDENGQVPGKTDDQDDPNDPQATQKTSDETGKETDPKEPGNDDPNDDIKDPPDWRKEIAESYGNGDKKVTEKELRRLERIKDPSMLYAMYREAENRLTSGGLVKKPGDDPTEAEKAAWNKVLGVPEEPSGYLEDIKLDNGAVIGEQDKPMAESFAEALHSAGAPPSVYQAALNWYFNQQQSVADATDETDENFKIDSNRELREEFGGAFNRHINNMPAVFALAPGGSDLENENSLISRLLGGRMSDGRLIGDDPDMIRWAVAINKEINPVSTVLDMENASGKGLDEEIKQIEQIMREDKRDNTGKYFKDEKLQARYRELLEARDKASQRA